MPVASNDVVTGLCVPLFSGGIWGKWPDGQEGPCPLNSKPQSMVIDGKEVEMVEALQFRIEQGRLVVDLGGGYVFDRPVSGSMGTFRILEDDDGCSAEV